MKSKLSIFFIVMLCVISINVIGETVVVDPSVQYQTMKGWGTSLCWFANVIGGWSSSNKEFLADLLFTLNSEGIGLNIVRYNIGGGDDPSHNHMRTGGEVPGFQPSPGVWDWQADANQRWFLQAAKARGVNIFEAFSNSPPYWMTYSGCSSGADNASSNNLRDDYYDDFADYLTGVVRHFRDSWGITFQTLNPMNEANTNYWGSWGGQEGCHFDISKQDQLIDEVYVSLTNKGLSTQISAPDETSISGTIADFNGYDTTTKNRIAQINAHSYGGGDRAQLKSIADSWGKRLWMSEYGTGERYDGHNHEDIRSALDLAWMINEDLNNLKAEAWIYWQAIEDEYNMANNENKNWGLLHADMAGSSEDWSYTKQFDVMKQYSRFIRPGYVIIQANNCLAAYSASDRRLVIVYFRWDNSNNDVTYNLSGFGSVGNTVEVYRTSGDEWFTQLSSISVNNKSFSHTAKAQSVTTYVLNNTTIASSETPAPTPQPTPVSPLGDVNNDGLIDIVDALLVAQFYVGLNPANFNVSAADTNCDGSIDIVDALLIAQYYVGLISRFC